MPINESFPLKKAESPYGESKKICEEILKKLNNSNHSFKNITLRYFNPIGAHPTGLIGELPIGSPENLVPYITQTAIGKRDFLSVFGDNYKTKDGTCIRDYINIMDLAEVHIACLEKLIAVEDENFFKIYNVGTGKGTSVFELINLFENVNDIKLNYKIGDRRKGDVISAYADTTKIKEELNWSTKYSLENALKSAWNWELNLNKDE
jgi:UDP-glucose 4-epimerase